MSEITVVITSYKLEQYIARCLDELFAQTMQDFNILIVDDASPDRTAEIIKQYQAKYPHRLHTILLEDNLGSPAKTRNVALDSGMIDGKYTVFLDGDDGIEPDFLLGLYEKAEETGADIALCAYDRIDQQDGKILCQEMTSIPSLLYFPADCGILPFVNTSLWNKLILTSLLVDIRFPDFCVGEDLVFLYRIYERCSKISTTGKILIHYYVRSGSVISSTAEDTIHAFADELSKLLRNASGTMSEALALTTFIHIGISMPLRAIQNGSIDMRELLRWTKAYLTDNVILYGRRSLSFTSLIRRGTKGAAIWLCVLLYRINCMLVFCRSYSFFTKLFHFDIKF